MQRCTQLYEKSWILCFPCFTQVRSSVCVGHVLHVLTYSRTHARTLTLLPKWFYRSPCEPSAHFLPTAELDADVLSEPLRAMGKQQKHQRGGAKKFTEGPPSESEEEEEEVKGRARGVGAQSDTAGMLPPNSSDEEEEEEEPKKGRGQSATAGMMPPGSSDEESDDEPQQPQLTRKEREQLEAQQEEEPDPEQIAKDMDRLAIIKKRREEQAAARIEKDGWDRMKPMSEDNHPPNMTWPPAGGGS